MSTVNNGPQIVTNGLVLNLDASSRKSYPAIEALIVAGGGSGGVDNGGGGGGGGVISTALIISVNTAYSIVVGAGGAARLGSSDDGPGNNGGNSTAFGYTAIGGSGGTGWVNTTLPPGSATYSGGSGAGQSVSTGGTNSRGAGTGTSGQGFNGGTGVAAYAGGGGGAGGLGGNATSGNVGAGGEGLYVGNLFGYSVGVDGYVAGGGAGGFDVIGGYSSTLPFTRNGTVKKLTQTAEDACPNNTGAGGNGGNHNNNTSGAGGSGVVFVRYFGPQRATGGTIYSFRGYTIHRFDSNGTFTLTSGDTTTWYDLSGNNNNGTLTNGPTFSANNKGIIVFDGTDDYVSITQNSNTRLQNNYQTLSFFVYITSVGPNAVAFLYTVGANANGVSVGWLADSVRFFISNGASNVNYPVNMTNALNTWMNITSIVDNINRTITVYKNGSLVGTSSQWSVFTPPSSTVTIGNNSMTGNTGDYIKGRVANVLVYNRSLTASEISQNYQSTKTRFGL
jgi:hypothetical protein